MKKRDRLGIKNITENKQIENIRQIPVIPLSVSNIRGEPKSTNSSAKLLLSTTKSAEWLGRKTGTDDMKMQDIDRISTNTQRKRQISSRFVGVDVDDLKALPLLVETPGSEREALFLEKVGMCCTLFDFNEPTKQVKSKEIKRITLVELAEYITMNQNCLTEPIYHGLVDLLQTNAFRVLTESERTNPEAGIDEEEEESNLEPSWPHLQLVYETFLRFVSSPDFQPVLGKRYINQEFLTHFVQLFDSEDSREREYVKTILHRIYGKLVNLRSFIRRLIDYVFLRFIYEEDEHNGIAELLDIMDSIINGFQVPLKEEHKIFLRRVLLPLHKARSYGTYHNQITNCVTEFIKKDGNLLIPVLTEGVLRYWPKVNSNKEVLFLNELEACLECASCSEFQSVARPVFTQVARCIGSLHFQVSERALFIWNNEYILSMMAENMELICPIIFPALSEAKNHWNKVVQGLIMNAINWAMEIDQKLVEKCSRNLEADSKKAADDLRRRKENWTKLESSIGKGSLVGVKLSQPFITSDPNAVQRLWNRSRPTQLIDTMNPLQAAPKNTNSRESQFSISNSSTAGPKSPASSWTITDQQTATTKLPNKQTNPTKSIPEKKETPTTIVPQPTTTATESVPIYRAFYSTPVKPTSVLSPRSAEVSGSNSTAVGSIPIMTKDLATSVSATMNSTTTFTSSIPNATPVNRHRKGSTDGGKKSKVKSKDTSQKQGTGVRRLSQTDTEISTSKTSQSGGKRSTRSGM